jgi:PAS domain-containing protein
MQTMRELAERERDFNAALYAAVQRAALDGILLVDSQEKIISYNQRFVEIWKVPPELMVSRSDARVFSRRSDSMMEPNWLASSRILASARLCSVMYYFSRPLPARQGEPRRSTSQLLGSLLADQN